MDHYINEFKTIELTDYQKEVVNKLRKAKEATHYEPIRHMEYLLREAKPTDPEVKAFLQGIQAGISLIKSDFEELQTQYDFATIII